MIPARLRTPGVYTGVNINTQRTGLPANTHKVLFITHDAQMSLPSPMPLPDIEDAPVAIPQARMPINTYDPKSADRLFGENSVAGRMVAAAIKTNRFVDVQCLGKLLVG